MSERSDFDSKNPEEIDFGSESKDVILRAERIIGDSREAHAGEKGEVSVSEIVKESAEKDDIESIEQIRRLLDIIKESELNGQEESREENLKIAMMVSRKGNLLDAEQKETVLSRIRKINEAFSGVASIDEGMVDRVFWTKNLKGSQIGYKTEFFYDNADGYIFLSPGSFSNNSVIDHELLHTLQHKNCPNGLTESLTCYFTSKVENRFKEIRSKKSLKSAIRMVFSVTNPYFVDYLMAKTLSDIVGEDALVDIYFKGDDSLFSKRYKQKAGKGNASKRMLQFQRTTEFQKRIGVIDNRFKREPLVLLNLFRKLNILFRLYLDTLR